MSARETALAALLGVVTSAATGATVVRNDTADERLPAGGLVVVRDGQQTDELEMFSPLRFAVTHQADVEIIAATEAARDTLLGLIVAALLANRTLSGAVDWTQPEAPDLATVDFPDAQGMRAARLPVSMLFTVLGSAAA